MARPKKPAPAPPGGVPFAVPAWPGCQVEMRKLADLHLNPRNSRTHPAEQIAAIRAAFKEFGWTTPMLIDDQDLIIAGHGRLEAGTLEGFEYGPCIVARGWTEEQKRAYLFADNRIAEMAGWDDEIRRIELGFLQEVGFPLEALGLDIPTLEDMLATPNGGRTDPEASLDPPENPVSVLGDIWQLGDHRVMCGDSTDPESVTAVLAGAAPHLMVTDPPYGVNYDPAWRIEAVNSGKLSQRGTGRRQSVGVVVNDDRVDWAPAWALFPGDVAYVWSAPGPLQIQSFASIEAAGFDVRQQIIWVKEHFALGRGNYHYQHEPCWYAVRKGRTAHWQGSRSLTTRWDIIGNNGYHQESEATGHSTQKPIECMRRPMENNSRKGEAVYDPFLGSGTSVIAAEMLGRKCLGLEINPAYCDVIVRRWQDFAGKEAVLPATGRTYAETKADRLDAAEQPAPAPPPGRKRKPTRAKGAGRS